MPPPLDPSSAGTKPGQSAPAGAAKARQPKPKRERTRSVRFTASEDAEVKAKLAGRDFSEVARALFLGTAIPEPKVAVKTEVVRRQMSGAEAERNRQLVAIGGNINQIARRANQGAEGAEILAALISLEREIQGGHHAG